MFKVFSLGDGEDCQRRIIEVMHGVEKDKLLSYFIT